MGLVAYIVDILQTRIGGFYGLLNALRKTGQTKAVEILESSTLVAILESTVAVHGVQSKIGDTFPALVKLDIKTLMKQPKIKDDFISIYEDGSTKLQIFEHGIPEKYTSNIYVPRRLSNRVKVKEELFKVGGSDIFVFAGIKRHELTNLVQNNGRTSTSSQEIMKSTNLSKLSAQYIELEDEEHWDCLQEIVNGEVPMHLIQVEKAWSGREYVIMRSNGISNLVQQYITNTRHSLKASVSEDEFVESLDKSTNSVGICICDEPGMGKSWLLANIAQKLIQTSETLCVGCFVPIANFMNTFNQEDINEEIAIRAILSYSRSSQLSVEIVFFLVHESKLKLECFFDGFDELRQSQQDIANKLIAALNHQENIRVFVTARQHMRAHLESLLGVTAYDIIPFTTNQQKQYLTDHWRKKMCQHGSKCTSDHVNRLNDFATSVLPHFPRHGSESMDGECLGVPLTAFLLAEAEEKRAIRYAKIRTLTLKFISPTNQWTFLTDLFSKYLYMGLAKSEKATSNSSFQESLVAFHTCRAMILIFPNYAFSDGASDLEHILESDLLAVGFLQKTPQGLEFFHRMFAEFLVARYFAEAIGKKELEKKLVTTFFTEFLRCQKETPIFNDFDRAVLPFYSRSAYLNLKNINSCIYVKTHFESWFFRNSTLVGFLNAIIEQSFDIGLLTGSVSQDLFGLVEDNVLFKILIASAGQTLCHVLKLLLRLIELNSDLYDKAKTLFDYNTLEDYAYYYSWHFIYTASISGNGISEQVTSFLLETMKKENFFKMMPEWMKTPLHVAIGSNDYNGTEYFLKYISLKDRCLVYSILYYSIYKSPDVIKVRENILRMLESKDNTLLDESSVDKDDGTCDFSGPICIGKIHFDLIKVMVDLKANICATDFRSRNVLSNAAMDASRFKIDPKDLFRFLDNHIDSAVMNDLLNTKYFTKPNLSEGPKNYLFDLPLDFVERIVRLPGFDVNQRLGDYGFLSLIHYSQYADVTHLLISRGADIEDINVYSGENVAHSISKRFSDAEIYFKWTTYMMNAGYSRFWEAKDNDGITPLDYAIMNGDVKKECIELIISKIGIGINLRRKGKLSLVQVAAKHGTLKTLKALTEIGADWKQQDKRGRSTLHLSVKKNKFEVMEYLMSQGVSIHSVDHVGRKPIHEVSSRWQTVEITSFLLNHGADLFAVDLNGNTVAHNVDWTNSEYFEWKRYIVSIGKGELFEVRNNGNLLPKGS